MLTSYVTLANLSSYTVTTNSQTQWLFKSKPSLAWLVYGMKISITVMVI